MEIDELVDKKLGEGLALQRMVKLQVEEEMESLIPLKHHRQGLILTMHKGLLLDLIGLLKLITVLKMQLFPVLKKLRDEPAGELHKVLMKTLLNKDHPLKARIHHLQESRDQEITVPGLMINPVITIDQ